MPLALRYAARSDVGLIRARNEDSGYAGPRLLVVADGMGGHAAGELASATAVATLAEFDEELATGDVLAGLSEAVEEAGHRIGVVTRADPDLAGMGTTVTGMFWQGDRMAIVHVGDSRAYLLRDDVLTQITHDHTYVQTLVDAGRITAEEATTHPRRNLIMRAIDGVNPVEPDLSVREARAGDRYLICSDGLSGVVPADQLHHLLAQQDPTGAVTALVERALENGAPDNVTVVVADVVEVEDEPDDAVPAELGEAVVVGAAGEPRVRAQLPGVAFPHDAQPDPDRPDPPPPGDGPPTAPQPLLDPDQLPEPAPPGPQARAAAAQRARRRRRWSWGLLAGGVVVLLLVLALVGLSWVRNQWYVGDAGGSVAVFNGVSGSLAGISLQQVDSVSTVAVDTLPSFSQEQVRNGIPAADAPDAQRIVDELSRQAAACADVRPPAGCPVPVPAPTPTATASASPVPDQTTAAPTADAPVVSLVTPAPAAAPASP